MILSDQSAMSTQDAKDGVEKGRQASGQKAGPVRIQCKQAGVEQAAECMVMSGDLGSQVCAICLCIHVFVWLPSCPFHVCSCVRLPVCVPVLQSAILARTGIDRVL